MKRIKAGIIGLGVGLAHAKALAAHERCEAAVLCDFSREKLLAAKGLFPGARCTSNAGDVVHNPDIDLVVVASYDNFHHRQILAALDNGKHVLAEKPFCLHPDEAVDIRNKLAKNPGLRFTSNLSLRTCPRFIRVRDAVGKGELGELFRMDGDYFWGRKHKLTHGWRKDMDFYSIIHGAAVHMVDLLLWIKGDRPVELHAYGNRICTAGTAAHGNDFASIHMIFNDGCVGRVTANGGCVHPHFHGLAVYGVKKSFKHDMSGAERISLSESGFTMDPARGDYPARGERAGIVTTFVDSIITSTELAIVTQDDVFDAMSVCFAAERSVQESRPVRVEYL